MLPHFPMIFPFKRPFLMRISHGFNAVEKFHRYPREAHLRHLRLRFGGPEEEAFGDLVIG